MGFVMSSGFFFLTFALLLFSNDSFLNFTSVCETSYSNTLQERRSFKVMVEKIEILLKLSLQV